MTRPAPKNVREHVVRNERQRGLRRLAAARDALQAALEKRERLREAPTSPAVRARLAAVEADVAGFQRLVDELVERWRPARRRVVARDL